MANRPRTSASDWIEAGYELFGRLGPDGVRIDVLAAQLGVAKSGFYHRFADREALLDSIIERWREHASAVYARASSAADPEARLRAIGYQGLGDEKLRRADSWLLLRGVADPETAEQIRTVREQAVSWVREQLSELGFEGRDAGLRAYVYYVSYLGMIAEIGVRPTCPDDVDLRSLVDDVVDLVITPAASSRSA